ncbi:hypothetical protein PtrM4_103970 [Pyrenophora tritici-repentis]|uniref:Altered inheritance of mitochondria protein 9, mitochondrial n=1 Tax=Pyrenophora tritici-repentis TaxID=45151 RepID=A0A834RUR7_9PLEO|nr:hypothetical protein PtrM4_103970 [Pyrenophora tritici-repentis]
MEKAKGVPLSQVWDAMPLPQKLQVLLALVQIQKRWLSISFSHYGGLYYASDVRSPSAGHYIEDGTVARDSESVVGPATGRDWHDAGRASLDIRRGPWASLSQYLRSIGERETKATQILSPPKQIALFCGPKLYQPDPKEKLTALSQYHKIADAILPGNKTICAPYLWHDDLHGDNIFVDPNNPGKITAIIDWQSCHISPLFNHNADPAFLDWEGLEPENLDLTPKPDLAGLSSEEKSAALRDYAHLNVFIAWRKLMQGKNPIFYKAAVPKDIIIWAIVLSIQDSQFPFNFSGVEIERIKSKGDCAVAETELVAQVKETMGELWPDKGLIDHQLYDSCRAALKEMKEQLIEQLALNEEERAEYERYWPFD